MKILCVSLVAFATGFSQATSIDTSNMAAVVADVKAALQQSPADAPTFDGYTSDFNGLIADLTQAAGHLPVAYQQQFAEPFIQFLTEKLGESDFYQVCSSQDPETHNFEQMIADLSLAILLHGQNEYNPASSMAFQELISDLYDGFLAKERSDGIPPPTTEILPPLVKWGNPEAGPYTIPIDGTSQLGLHVGVVSLPPTFAYGGLLAWISLGHETCGHDVCHAYPDLLPELKQQVHTEILAQFQSPDLASYWENCLDETISDVCGVLNMGPTAGLGLIAFFRGMAPDGKLRTSGDIRDPHPLDILRAFLASQLVLELSFSKRDAWSQAIYNEAVNDLSGSTLFFVDGNTGQETPFPVDNGTAIRSAYAVGHILANAQLTALNGHSFLDVQNWSDQDQQNADLLAEALANSSPLPTNFAGPGFFATHVVSGAVQQAFTQEADLPGLFRGMISYLDEMNQTNPEWKYTGTGHLPETVWMR